MRKLISFMHTSLDGFVAGTKGEMDWINVDDEIFDYAGHNTNDADTGLYGRVTYDMMESYWPTAGDQPNASKHDKEHSQWYNNVEKIVLSKSLAGKNIPKTQIVSSNIKEEILKHKNKNGKNIIMFGSPSASHTLLQLGLIDEYWLFVNPVLLGAGIPLFKNINEPVKLNLIKTKVFKCGVTGMHFEISK
ncbi:MAG TPA: dihydrofolate reductase family protein [Bacteroidia bacterium]|nr:dihydrofolate reductase family protein [Bacteroidia bacterium]